MFHAYLAVDKLYILTTTTSGHRSLSKYIYMYSQCFDCWALHYSALPVTKPDLYSFNNCLRLPTCSLRRGTPNRTLQLGVASSKDLVRGEGRESVLEIRERAGDDLRQTDQTQV